MKKRTKIFITLSIIIAFLVLFSTWEYTTNIYENMDIGRQVSFTEPMVVYTFIPESLAGKVIASKFNAVIESQNNDLYRSYLKYSKVINMDVNTVYLVSEVIEIKVLGLFHRSFRNPITYYILKDPEGRLLPMRRGLYEGTNKLYH